MAQLFGFLMVLSPVLSAPSSYWQKGPCGEDVKKYCMEAAPGEVISCLRAHEKDAQAPLSEECRKKFAEKRGQSEGSEAKGAVEKK